MNSLLQFQTPTGDTDRMVRCPQCGGQSLYASRNVYRPFCSERCKMIDLGHWSAEGFRVPVNPEPTENEEI